MASGILGRAWDQRGRTRTRGLGDLGSWGLGPGLTLSPFPKSGGQLAIGFYIHSFVANNIYNYLTIEKKGLEGLVG